MIAFSAELGLSWAWSEMVGAKPVVEMVDAELGIVEIGTDPGDPLGILDNMTVRASEAKMGSPAFASERAEP